MDTPKPPTVVDPGLAGSSPPDVTRYLLVRGANSPELSPDGQVVAFKVSTTGRPQLWTVSANGGWPRQLTFGRGITFHAWGPKAAGLIYGADTDGDERESYVRIRSDGAAETVVRPHSKAFVVFGAFSSDGKRIVYSTTERNGVDFDVHVLDVASGQSTEVRRGRYAFLARAWQPGGPWVVVTESRGEGANDVHLVNVDTKESKVLFRPDEPAQYSAFSWSPDGRGFYLATNQGRELMALARYDLASGKLTMMATPEGDVESVKLSADGQYLAWTVNERGYSRLYISPASPFDASTNLAPEALPAGVIGDLTWASEAPVLAVSVTGPTFPEEVWTYDIQKKRVARAAPSSTAGLDLQKTAVVPTSHVFTARDGVQLHGLLYSPEGTVSAPVVLRVHGGPTAQARPTFRPVIQYLVARGIAVFDLNFRGSTGFGKRFAALNDRRKRPDELNDLADTVAWLKARPGLDGSRVAIMGGSYGGYLTNAAVGVFPDMFAAGVSFVGVSDWVRALQGASPALKASDRFEYGDVSDPEDRAFLASLSPMNKVDRIKAPMMIVHGANDPRDPVTESDRFVQAIRKNGQEVTYLRFADEGHGIRKLSNRIHTYRAVAAFLEKHLKL